MLPSFPCNVLDSYIKLHGPDSSLTNWFCLLYLFFMLGVSLLHILSTHISIGYYNWFSFFFQLWFLFVCLQGICFAFSLSGQYELFLIYIQWKPKGGTKNPSKWFHMATIFSILLSRTTIALILYRLCILWLLQFNYKQWLRRDRIHLWIFFKICEKVVKLGGLLIAGI